MWPHVADGAEVKHKSSSAKLSIRSISKAVRSVIRGNVAVRRTDHVKSSLHNASRSNCKNLRYAREVRNIFDAPWFIRNADLRRDLQMEMVANEMGKFAKKYEERLLHHVNVEAIPLLDISELVRRVKKIHF